MKNEFKNPMLCGADPFVLFYEGKYYMYCTTETEEELPTVEFSKIREQIEDLNRERNPTDLRRKKKLQRGG